MKKMENIEKVTKPEKVKTLSQHCPKELTQHNFLPTELIYYRCYRSTFLVNKRQLNGEFFAAAAEAEPKHVREHDDRFSVAEQRNPERDPPNTRLSQWIRARESLQERPIQPDVPSLLGLRLNHPVPRLGNASLSAGPGELGLAYRARAARRRPCHSAN